MAYIEKRVSKDGEISYRVQVRLKGHRQISDTFPRLTDARKWGQSTEAAIRERRYFKTTESAKHTLAELIDRFIRYELPKLPKVQRMLNQQLTWWRAQLGHLTLADVTPAELSAVRDRLMADGSGLRETIAPATVNRYLAALSIAFSTAVTEWGWLEDNPLRKVKKLKEPTERVRYLTDDERRRLLDACTASTNPYLYAIVVLALSTGARKMELLTLRWRDVDVNAGRIVLNATKNNERRSVPLTGHALQLIRQLRKVRHIDSDLLFPSPRNTSRPIVIEDPWKKALRRADINDFRFHDLRHSTASYLAMNGASLIEIAAVLGHKTLAMVKRYAHLSEDHTRDVVTNMTRTIFG